MAWALLTAKKTLSPVLKRRRLQGAVQPRLVAGGVADLRPSPLRRPGQLVRGAPRRRALGRRQTHCRGHAAAAFEQLAKHAHEKGLLTGATVHDFNRWAQAEFSIDGVREHLPLDGLAVKYGDGTPK